jgi:hypothetical protein
MHAAGFQELWTPEIITAVAMAKSQQMRNSLEEVTAWFRNYAVMVPQGLDSLPACWTAELPVILRRGMKKHWTHIPYFIDKLQASDGLLLLHFVQEERNLTGRLTAWDKLRISVNSALMPNLWRPLSASDLTACKAHKAEA